MIDSSFKRKSRSNKICLLCREPKQTRGVMCDPCYAKIRRTDVILKCRLCEKEFAKQLGEYKKQIKRRPNAEFYCGLECSRAHHAIKNAGSCKGCGKPKPRTSRYCSEECKAATRKARAAPRKVFQCRRCGKDFEPHNKKSQFCGLDCANAAHSLRMTGAGNSRFKDADSYAKIYRGMRTPVLDRDGYRCVDCGDPERLRLMIRLGEAQFRSSLTIHHINEKVSDNRIENLVVLCQECHMTHHKSHQTPFPWLGEYAAKASESMTSKWKDAITSLATAY
jgi:5-methylcytosine-specific restriction endonuclease McrA